MSCLLVNALHAEQLSLLDEKRKDYTFRRQSNEKPSTTAGCPALLSE